MNRKSRSDRFQNWLLWLAGLAIALALVAIGYLRNRSSIETSTLDQQDHAITRQSQKQQTADLQHEPFDVVVYNVENLFDVDGIALYDDYKPAKYQPRDLLTKIKNITRVLSDFREGRGPQIIMFQEFEADQSPGDNQFEAQQFLADYAGTSVDVMLTEGLTDEVRDLPVQAFLLKSLQDAGLTPYQMAMGEYRRDPTDRVIAHVNATFSQFPIQHATTHHTNGARGILEVVHDLDGHPLITLNNHWKSGAGNSGDEKIRIGNATVLKKRLDQILKENPDSDVIIGGDFNSHYNQAEVNAQMTQTGINGILESQGDESALRDPTGSSLYNLWYELPEERRGSDVYQGHWGTLMQVLLTRGLYDHRGIQYVDNSFDVVAIENVNCQTGSLVPIDWKVFGELSGGYSDHLPICARFRLVGGGAVGDYIDVGPSRPSSSAGLRPVDYAVVARSSPAEIGSLSSDADIKLADRLGHAFRVQATVTGNFPFRVKLHEQEYLVWSPDETLRKEIYQGYSLNSKLNFVGELGIYKEQWQFVVRDRTWLEPHEQSSEK